ncbi:hypothetical protein SPHINGOT1_80117 [Sphingomonas sp. T1]|nr:hypothetical protein SPHINGOT1_80117 [Sphingomonas sp. T1]
MGVHDRRLRAVRPVVRPVVGLARDQPRQDAPLYRVGADDRSGLAVRCGLRPARRIAAVEQARPRSQRRLSVLGCGLHADRAWREQGTGEARQRGLSRPGGRLKAARQSKTARLTSLAAPAAGDVTVFSPCRNPTRRYKRRLTPARAYYTERYRRRSGSRDPAPVFTY